MNVAILIILIYISLSFMEWSLHKFVMHGNPEFFEKIPLIGKILAPIARDHLRHHKHVNIDMTLSQTKTNGLYFWWSTTLVFIVIALIITKFITPVPIVLSVLVHNILWNNWHTRFHKYDQPVNIKEGLPTFQMFPLGPIYDYLWKYHAIHHSQKGEKYNFNIILPLFDHLFGTLGDKSCIDNTLYCKTKQSDYRCHQDQYYCYTKNDIH